MKTVQFAVVLICALYSSSFAQSDTKSFCPTISLIGPEGIIKPESRMVVEVELSQNNLQNLTYNWSVNKGKVISGEHSQKITIETGRVDGSSPMPILVNVQVLGLPSGCELSGSDEYLVQRGNNDFFPVDEYGDIAQTDEKGHLDNLAILTIGVPNTKGFIIKTFKTGTPEREVLRKIQRLKNFLFAYRKYPKDMFVIMVGRSDRVSTTLWRLLSTDAPPSCEGCKVF